MSAAAKTRVVIVGAGAAGLAAASRLVSSGLCHVTLVEATSRAGGRIHSFNFNGHSVELGAQWVHGEEGNVVFSIASKRGLLEDPQTPSVVDLSERFVDEDGDLWSEELMGKMRDVVFKAEEAMGEVKGAESGSLGTFIDEQWREASQEKDREFKQKLDIFKDFYHRLCQNVDGYDSWYDGSFSGSCCEYERAPGNDMVSFKNDSKYNDILDYFLENLDTEQLIRFNSEVTQIRWYDDQNLASVQLASGEVLQADYVIVTCSLGVLKAKVDSLFLPALPANKVKAIESIGFGAIGKIFLEFSETWWPTDRDGYGFLHKGMSNFKYTAKDAEVDWTRFIMGMYCVLHRPNVIFLWTGGFGTRKMETLGEEQVQEDVMRLLRQFLHKKFPVIPDPVGIKFSRWHSDPFFRGSYSYQSMSSTLSGLKPTTLAESVGQRGQLRFAGEATHSTFFSTVHGAVESGWREADHIVNLCTK